MPGRYSQIEFDYEPLHTNSHKYSLTFTGLNGHWDEVLRLQLVYGKWVQALKVIQERFDRTGVLSRTQTVLEDVDDGFPKPVNWEEVRPFTDGVP